MNSEMLSPSPRVFLIRHGETDWSLSKRHTGVGEIPLTPNGEAQARALVPCLGSVAFSRVLTSPRRRARRTCELAGLGTQARVEPDLAEWDYGAYEGRLTADIRKAEPTWSLFHDGCPGGESPREVQARADRLIGRLAAETGNVALFSHAQFSAALAARWIGLAVAEGEHFMLRTASVSILDINPDHPDIKVVALWNAPPRPIEA
jgi:probable phosphoglycerate mutase